MQKPDCFFSRGPEIRAFFRLVVQFGVVVDGRLRFTAVGYAAKETAVRAMTAEQLRTEVADDRAREFPLEGHRWFDLRRTAQPAITKTYDGQTYTLSQNESRYTLPFNAFCMSH